ncbi:PadR family transcriptional regulator [Rhodococcus sp. IEGM 1366]|uniref:PadR family transcriptional regulator n=1 Tax=Rhodococcus sp. IEGM 1366 TaxID=3082223 RepID=UPI002954A395|nr:PadR family transcriptional regulator [Rhodococcus sp. IEGM 1366]MDV8070655.1 PadR family transcriptional regulator [Rhodococcus sp. IEGM 1366]
MARAETSTARSTLSATSWVVLGLLSFEPEVSGPELKKRADQNLQFFYSAPSYSHIYSELRNLEAHGFATSRLVITKNTRRKRMYAVTPAGTNAVATWVNDSPVESVVLKHGVMLRIYLSHIADSESLKAALTEHRNQSETMRIRAIAETKAAAEELGGVYPTLLMQWSQMYYESERNRANWMLENISRLHTRKLAPESRDHSDCSP